MAYRQGAVENLEGLTGLFSDIYQNRRVFLTGHTGFKGSWAALWLKTLGADVTGYALNPETKPNHWDLLKLDAADRRGDIRNDGKLAKALKRADPEIVFHMAAQPLVRRSYRIPVETWETNVMGTANLLEACRNLPNLKAIVVITTDKCYENKETGQAYNESDPLGGHDPYSASKAGTELVAASYRDAFYSKNNGPLLATARAGNVIGGGDWSEDRLIPDLVRAQAKGASLGVRSPNSTRPWQHVLEPLSGYLRLGQVLLEGKKQFASAWNFGPEDNEALSVSQLLERMKEHWPEISWHIEGTPSLHEAGMLRLDSGKARRELGWRPVLTMAEQLEMTASWYRAFAKDRTVLSAAQLKTYMGRAA